MYVVYNCVIIIITIILTFDASVHGRFLTFRVVLVDIGSGGGPHCLRIQESLAEWRSSMRHRWYISCGRGKKPSDAVSKYCGFWTSMTLWFFRMVLRILVALLPVGTSFNYLS